MSAASLSIDLPFTGKSLFNSFTLSRYRSIKSRVLVCHCFVESPNTVKSHHDLLCCTEKAKTFWSQVDVDLAFEELLGFLLCLREAIKSKTASDKGEHHTCHSFMSEISLHD